MNDQDPADVQDQTAAVPVARKGPPLGESGSSRHGLDEAFSDFYRSTMKVLVGFLINQGATLPTAADIAQETMFKAYRRWPDLRDPRAWTFKVASRALVRTIASIEEDPVERIPEAMSLLARPNAIEEWETRYDTLPLLRRLPPRQRQILAWTLAGYTPSDIAHHLNLSAETVRGNLKKARCAAAAYLREREEEQ